MTQAEQNPRPQDAGAGNGEKTPVRPLEGVRVLDMSRILAGPWCGMSLGDLGADVIKVENPDGGDDTRHLGTAIAGGERTYFLTANRNKRSIAIDFSTKQGQELVYELARESDVFIENYKLGGLDKFGLDYESMRAINPRLIYLSISGYGRVGAQAAKLGYDFVLQGESGFMSITGEPNGGPMKAGVPLVDVMTGMYSTQAVLAALIAREKTGEGQLIDMALFDCALANLSIIASNALLLDEVPQRQGNAHVDIAPYDSFACSDGDLIVTVANDAQFQRLCVALEIPQAATDPRFLRNDGRRKNRDALNEILNARFATCTRAHWESLLERAGVACGPVRNIKEALAVSEQSGRGMVLEIDHPSAGRLKVLGSPLKLRGTPVIPPQAPPMLGQHTDEVLRKTLKMSETRIAALREQKIVG
ncbi:MAG TPA: CaiB/BaiF CoA-transferase family protein [Burkholderiaceae bacterium]|nr:CaiB/BaiF CoA-transferase family protein [Burkholderiaceae bacterium]